jgi:hypothetical protein
VICMHAFMCVYVLVLIVLGVHLVMHDNFFLGMLCYYLSL